MGPSGVSPLGVARWLRAIVGVLLFMAVLLVGAQGAVASGLTFGLAPAPLVPAGKLAAVSCSSSRACLAVGALFNSGEIYGDPNALPLAERWDGATWTAVNVQVPAGAMNGSLAAVSCRSATFCVAVGFTTAGGRQALLVERWNGSRWSMQSAPMPARSRGASLAGVSCVSPRACIAVGGFINDANRELPLGARWNGARWSITELPRPVRAKQGSLNAVSCVSRSICLAVGVQTTSGELIGIGRGRPLAERWNGKAWSSQPIPNGSLPDHESSYNPLNGVSCVSARACLAVGFVSATSAFSSDNNYPLTERWNGSRWTRSHSRLPTSYDSTPLTAVSCAARRGCTAVGSYSTRGADVPLVARWNGSSWKRQATPRSDTYLLNGVSCSDARACTAVGVTNTSGTAAENWDGLTWLFQSTPPVALAISSLSGVSCPSLRACTAVGSYENLDGITLALAEIWNGTSWTVQEPPSPAGASSTQLNGVSCTSPTACIAVGDADHSSLIEMWNGTSWTIDNERADTQLNAVSCSSASACTAVGLAFTGTVQEVPFVERWNGAIWTVQPTPSPVGSSVSLTGVSCPSRTMCVAVGDGTVEVWDGAGWTIQSVSLPVNGSLTSVSCTSTNACTAVGGFAVATVERWDGSSWTTQAAFGGPADPMELNGVSCSSSGACTAVGYAETGPGQPVVAEGTGSGWTFQIDPAGPVNAPGGPHGPGSLLGVSCPAPTACTAVGRFVYGDGFAPVIAQR